MMRVPRRTMQLREQVRAVSAAACAEPMPRISLIPPPSPVAPSAPDTAVRPPPHPSAPDRPRPPASRRSSERSRPSRSRLSTGRWMASPGSLRGCARTSRTASSRRRGARVPAHARLTRRVRPGTAGRLLPLDEALQALRCLLRKVRRLAAEAAARPPGGRRRDGRRRGGDARPGHLRRRRAGDRRAEREDPEGARDDHGRPEQLYITVSLSVLEGTRPAIAGAGGGGPRARARLGC